MATTKALELAQLADSISLNANGEITTIGTLSSLDISGQIDTSTLALSGTTTSSNTTTGSLTVAGGLGVVENVNAGRLFARGVSPSQANPFTVFGTLGNVGVNYEGVDLFFTRPSASYFSANDAAGHFWFRTGGTNRRLLIEADGDIRFTKSANTSLYGFSYTAATSSVDIAGNLTVDGDFTVSGNTTTVNTNNLNIEDLNITLANGAANSSVADGAGITIDGASATILYDGTNDEWDFNKSVKISGSLGVTNIVTNYIPKFNGVILDDSNISDDGTTVTITGTTASAGGNETLRLANGSGATQLQFGLSENNYAWIQVDDAGTKRDLVFQAEGGEVGIGVQPISALDVRSTSGLGSVFRKDFNGAVANSANKIAMTIWGQDHDSIVETDQSNIGPMIGFGARVDDASPNTGDIRAGIAYSYNGDLTFHAKSGASVADGSNERIRIDGVSGSVGINHDAPVKMLSVNVASDSDGIFLYSNKTQIGSLSRTTVDSTVVTSLDGNTGRDIHIGGTINTNVILANAGGNVGIANTSPTNKLQIGDTGHSGYALTTMSNTYGAVIQVGESSRPTTAAALWVRNMNDNSDGNTTPTTLFRVDGDGQVSQTSDAASGPDWQVYNSVGNNAIRFEGGSNASLYLDGADGDFVGADYGRIYHDGTSLYLGTHSASNLILTQNEFIWNTNTGGTPFYITRSGGTNQALKIIVDDADVNFYSIQDEVDTGNLKFFLGTNADQNTGFSVFGEGSTTSLLDVRADGTTNIRGGLTTYDYKKNANYVVANTKPIPQLRFDFAAARSIHSKVSTVRSSSATYFDETGTMVNAPSHKARFDHDPLTGESLGLLTEKGSTNYSTYSDTSFWASVRGTKGASETIRGIAGCNHSDSTGDPNINLNVTQSTDAKWCFSFYVDPRNANYGSAGRFRIDFSTNGGAGNGASVNVVFSSSGVTDEFDQVSAGSITYGSDAVSGSGAFTAQYIGDSIWRVSLSFSLSTVVNSIFPIIYYGTGATDFWVGGCQLEVSKTYPTSLIITSGSSATRSNELFTLVGLDNLLLTDKTFSAYYEARTKYDPDNQSNAHCWAMSGQNFIFFYGASAGGSQSMGHAVRDPNGYPYAASKGVTNETFNKYAVRLRPNDGAGALNGVIENTDTAFQPIRQTQLNIGRGPGSSEWYTGHIKSIRLYNSGLSNNELMELTRQ